ncbi:MAG: MFS transporter [Micrococcales bacterium]|nr:MFS transporter [Micrococcales bacterium]MCL2668947.1 MFS transporter [Micrococcales bacterium]
MSFARAEARFPRRLLVTMMLGSVLNPINSSILAVALVPIGTYFGAPPAQTAWLVSSLYLAAAVGQPLVGRLVDRYGPKRLFLAGATLICVAGVVGMVAPNLWVLVAARVVLGLGTCAGYPSAMSLIRRVVDRRGMASPAGVLTVLFVTVQTTAVVGPTLGGLLVDLGGWRATLAINLPLGMAALGLGWAYLPSHVDQASQNQTGWPQRMDWPGVGLLTATLLGLLLFSMQPGVAWLWVLGLGVVAGAGFVARERHTPDPFIDVRVLWGNLPLQATYLRELAAALVSYAFMYGFPQWLEGARGLSPSGAGAVLLAPFAVGIVVSALFGRRPRVRVNLLVGTVVQGLICVLLLGVGATTPMWALVGATVLLGVPEGLLSLSNQNALYLQARPDAIGASSGLLRSFQYFGAIGASAAVGAAFGTHVSTSGLHNLAWFMLAVTAVELVIVLLDRSLGRLRPSATFVRTLAPEMVDAVADALEKP